MKMSVIHNGSFNDVFSYSFNSFHPADILSYFHLLMNLLWIFSLSSPFARNCLPSLLKIPLHIFASVLLPHSLFTAILILKCPSHLYFSLHLPFADHFSPSMPRCLDSSPSLACFTCLNLQLPSFHSLCSLLPSACTQVCSLFSPF